MKKVRLDASKLQLKKEKIAEISGEQMNQIKGGEDNTGTLYLCPFSSPPVCVTGTPCDDSTPPPPVDTFTLVCTFTYCQC